MEHRWGERIELDLPVRLNVRSRSVAQGRITNVSLSGALVATSERVRSQAYVDVEFNLTRSRTSKLYHVPAYVVRRTESGIALEWREFAPRAIRALFALVRARVIRETRAKRPTAVGHGGRPPASEPPNLIPNEITG